MHLQKYIISLLTLALGKGQTQNVAHYPLHHMTLYTSSFEADISNGLEGNALTRNIWFDLDPRSYEALSSTSCDLCTAKFEVATANGQGDVFTRKYLI